MYEVSHWVFLLCNPLHASDLLADWKQKEYIAGTQEAMYVAKGFPLWQAGQIIALARFTSILVGSVRGGDGVWFSDQLVQIAGQAQT